MCTLVILRRPGQDWPILIGANRDELINRPWLPPARHWVDRPGIIGGIDKFAGGTWLGMNDDGLFAAVLNRQFSKNPDKKYLSRGELPLKALENSNISMALNALSQISTNRFRPFNMVIADSQDAYLIRPVQVKSESGVDIMPIPDGLSMITSGDRNDTNLPRIRRYLPMFARAAEPDPESDDWSGWASLLSNRNHNRQDGPEGAMFILSDTGFGTVSSSLIALPSKENQRLKPKYLFAATKLGDERYLTVDTDK